MAPVVRRIDRYVLSELVGPFGLGLLVYTFILLVQFFFRLAEMIIKRGLPAATVLELLADYLPSVVVLTIPMSLLLAVLVGIGRLASDSELIALRASGVGLFRILRPVFLAGLFLAGVNAYLMLDLVPRANTAHTRLLAEVVSRTLAAEIEPRVFYNEFQGKVLYVFDTSPDGRDWSGVFLADSVTSSDRPSDVVVAERGRLTLVDDGQRVLLELTGALQHTFELARPDRYETRRYEKMQIVLRDRYASEQRERSLGEKSVRGMTWPELRAVERDPATSGRLRIQARIHRQKMLAIPIACPVFALLALPLAFNNRRGGKSSGFALSIGIVVAYYVLLSQGEKAALAEKLPPAFALWLPNLLLGAVGLMLLVARDRDRPPVPRTLARALAASRARAALGRALAAGGAALGFGRRPRAPGRAPVGGARVVVRLPRLRLRFPNLIDRYVLKLFGYVLTLVFASGVTLLVITDLTENVDEILTHRPAAAVIVRYYKYLALQLAYEIAPVVVLVTTLVTFSLLARTNEVVACRALGISVYRLALPALAAAIGVGAAFALLEARVLPASNQKVAEAKTILKGGVPRRAVRGADQQWQTGSGGFLYNFLHFDERRATLRRLQVFQFDDRFLLRARLFAEEARWTGARWTVARGWTRSFAGREQLTYRPFDAELGVDLPESPGFFVEEVRRPAQMTFAELAEYTADLRASGRPQPRYEVELHNKIAFPIGAVVMAMVGFPFAFRLEKRGALYGLGVSVALGLAFVLVYAFFTKLGEAGALPPPVAVWSPGALFSLLAAYLFLGVRT
jgi:LPS export ABC transporter permease LptF/LPS export ABC transporter permease LptG